MRFKVGILTICVSLLAACGPGHKRDRNGQATIVTHGNPSQNDAQAPQPSEFTDNGDERVEEFLRNSPRKPDPTPAPPPEQPATPPKPGADNRPIPELKIPEQKTLAKQLKEFQITRYSKDRENPQQLGMYRAEFKLFFTDGKVVAFHGPFKIEGKKLKFEEPAEGMVWSGFIEDLDDESKGEFTLTRGQESAKVFYTAWKSNLQVRPDAEKPLVQGSQADQFAAAFKSHDVYGWVHNWVVADNGEIVISTYLMDMVNNGPLQITFAGESKRTGESEHPVTVKQNSKDKKPGPKVEASLVGNAAQGNHKVIAVKVKNDKGEDDEFLVDVSPAKPRPKAKPKPEDVPQQWQSSGDAFMQVDLGSPRSSKMAQDFEKNRGQAGVDAAIAYFQRDSDRKRGIKGGRTGLQNFFSCSSAFRPLMTAVGQAYDVSPSFAYLTVVESLYFTGCEYEIQKAPASSAVGPFQLLTGTATKTLGMRVDGALDERRYFKPSACAAAKYVGMNVDLFSQADSTLGILAYYQGDGGAAAALYCTFSPQASKACADRINPSAKKKANGVQAFTGADYGRFKKLVRSYNYRFGEMDELSMIPADMRDYVNKKLAVYFISNDMSRYGFANPGPPPAKFPAKARGTISPGAVRDPVCNAIPVTPAPTDGA